MFQKTSHNTDNMNIFCLSFYSRDQTADTADYHINMYSRAGCFHQLVHNTFICQRVHLQADICLLSGFCMFNLLINHGKYFVLETFWRNKKIIHIFNRFSHCQCLEYSGCFCSDLRISGHQRKVCIQTGCFFVVISCSDLCIIFHISIFFLHNLAKFGMYFITIQTVDHMTSRIFQKSGPSNIVLLIKTCLQLHQNEHFFSIFCRFDQSFHNLTLFRYTVKSHLDGNDILIIGCFMKHCKKRFDTLIWIGKKTVFFRNLVKNRFMAVKHRRFLRNSFFIKKLCSFSEAILDLEYKRKIQRDISPEYKILVHFQIIAKCFNNISVHFSGKFQTDWCQFLSCLNQLHHKFTIIQIFIVKSVCVNICISGNTKQGFCLDVVTFEDF